MKLKNYYDEQYANIIKSLARSTAVGYESSYRKYIEPRFGDCELHEIRVKDINAWLATFTQAGAAEKAYKTLRQIIRASIADEVYPESVVDPTTRSVRLPKKPWRGEGENLKPREVKALLLAVVGFEYEANVICGLWLGLRRSEQCGLQWRDLDLKTGLVQIRRGLQFINGDVIVTNVKTHRSMRPHMLPRAATERLREIKRERRPKPTDWLLGENPNPDRYARRLKSHCKNLGVKCVAPKFFRHTFRVNARKAGIPEQDIQKMLGHKEFSTTFIYMSLDGWDVFKWPNGTCDAVKQLPKDGADEGSGDFLYRAARLPSGLFVSRNYAEISVTVEGGYQMIVAPYEDSISDVNIVKFWWKMSPLLECAFVVRVHGRWRV